MDWTTLREGQTRKFEIEKVDRTHFVRYAGASGDFNPIHHDQTFAERAGLPTVFGVGMWTAGVLSRIPADWFGPESIAHYSVRFSTRLWPGDSIVCSGEIVKVYEHLGRPHADIELRALNQKGETLIAAKAIVRQWLP